VPSTPTSVVEAPVVMTHDPESDAKPVGVPGAMTHAPASDPTPAAAVTGDIAALTEELKKVNEEVVVEKRKSEALRNVCQEHENTIVRLRGEPDHQKIVNDRRI
jgi:hypothetical protein